MNKTPKEILDDLRKLPRETEWVEFKEAKDQLDLNKLGKYFSALSNEAHLQHKECGFLVLGVDDKKHNIVGTRWRENNHEGLKQEISIHTTGNMSFIKIDEIQCSEGRVLMFKIPAAPKGMPIAWQGHYYGRNGESLVALSVDEMDRIRGSLHDWSEDICHGATLDDLEVDAIDFAKGEFVKKHPALEAEIRTWDNKTFLNKAKLSIKGDLTKAAILLLGKPESAHFLSPYIGKMTWIVKDEKNKELDYEHFDPPFLLASERLRQKIRNLKYRYMPDTTLFPEEILKYDPWVLREALHNCIAHQDYTLHGKIVVVEKPDELIFSNMGSFLPGSIEKVIEEDSPPKQYRNPYLVNAMACLNMIDTIGSGIKRMYETQRERFFPMPTYDLKEREVTVRILGKILNPLYTNLLRENKEIELGSIILLDYVQKGIRVSKGAHKYLKNLKLVEGRYPNLYLSSNVHKTLNKKADYIKKKGFDDVFYEAMIIKYLQEYKKATRQDIENLLLEKIPDIFAHDQKKKKISNMLQKMRRMGQIDKAGGRRYAEWILISKSKGKI